MAINNFDVLKEMGARNLDIKMASLDNIHSMNYSAKKGGTKITIGVAGGNVIRDITFGRVVGGLILANKEQFDEIKKELKARESERKANG